MILYYLLGAAFVIAFVGVDIHLALDGVPRNTWSELGRAAARATPVLPWVVGVLAGHVFHPDWLGHNQWRYLPLLACTAVLVVVGVLLRLAGSPIPMWMPLVPGFIAGWQLWPSYG